VTDIQDCYRWYRQQDLRNHGGRLSRYSPKLSLAMARADVVKGTKRYPHTGKPYAGQWQALERMPRHSNPSGRAYYADTWPTGWRDLGDAHDVVSMRHEGWCADSFQDSLIIGRVLQLPARDGKPVYVPGTYSTGSDGVTLYPLDWYDDKADCARAADQYAERLAEIEREYSDAWQAGSLAASHDHDAKAIRSDIIALVRDLRKTRKTVTGNDALQHIVMVARREVDSMLREMSRLRKKRDKLVSEYTWLNNGFRDNGSRSPFLEGFGR
jgi:hypothetical protein